jgi:hypothetical protein
MRAARWSPAGAGYKPDDYTLPDVQADLLDAAGRREEALAARRMLKQRDPETSAPTT